MNNRISYVSAYIYNICNIYYSKPNVISNNYFKLLFCFFFNLDKFYHGIRRELWRLQVWHVAFRHSDYLSTSLNHKFEMTDNRKTIYINNNKLNTVRYNLFYVGALGRISAFRYFSRCPTFICLSIVLIIILNENRSGQKISKYVMKKVGWI